jgi:hypothetical protein
VKIKLDQLRAQREAACCSGAIVCSARGVKIDMLDLPFRATRTVVKGDGPLFDDNVINRR